MADQVWRSCTFSYREVEVDGVHRRICRLQESLRCGAVYVCPDTCATCPVPALVEAVEVAEAHCAWLLTEYQDGEMQAKPSDAVESSRCVYWKCEAALAAVKSTEGEGS